MDPLSRKSHVAEYIQQASLRLGAVHKVRHAILSNFDPLPPVTLCHTSRDPPKERHTSRTPPICSRPSTKNPDKSPLLFAGVFVRGVCHGVFFLEGFVPGGFCPFPLLSEYICYNRKLNITLNFMFHMY